MRHLLLAVAFASCLSASAVAQVRALSATDFQREVMMNDSFEQESSRLALQKSRNPNVRAFASMMLRDHGATSAALTSSGRGLPTGTVGTAAAGAGVGLLLGGPVGAAVGAGVGATAGAAGSGARATSNAPAVYVDQRRANMLNQLAASDGRRFDQLYASMQVAAHQEALGVFTVYAQTGRDAALVGFAQQTIPVLQQHFMDAQRLVPQ